MAQNKMNPAKSPPASKPASTTEMRNTAVPPRSGGNTQSAKKEIGYDQIAKRAYEIWQSRGGSEMDNWLQAERELRGK